MEGRFAGSGRQWLLGLFLVAGSLSAHATLLGRDINRNPVASNDPSAVFEYDTDLDRTWLRDWNYAKTTGYDADGLMSWNAATPGRRG